MLTLLYLIVSASIVLAIGSDPELAWIFFRWMLGGCRCKCTGPTTKDTLYIAGCLAFFATAYYHTYGMVIAMTCYRMVMVNLLLPHSVSVFRMKGWSACGAILLMVWYDDTESAQCFGIAYIVYTMQQHGKEPCMETHG